MSNRPAHDSENRPDEFEPGPSFADKPEASTDAPDALPSWLQNFADTVSTDQPAPTGTPGTSELSRPNVGPAAAAAPATGAPAPVGPAVDATTPTDSVGFFSDDDLPEWLRSLNPTTGGANTAAPQDALTASTPAATIAIPSVARVWVTPHEEAPAPPSAPLFASIASALDERPDMLLSEGPADSALPPTMPSEQPVIARTAALHVVRPNEGRWSRQVLWLVVAFIMMSLIMIGILMWLQ